jgi:hypothetical protein
MEGEREASAIQYICITLELQGASALGLPIRPWHSDVGLLEALSAGQFFKLTLKPTCPVELTIHTNMALSILKTSLRSTGLRSAACVATTRSARSVGTASNTFVRQKATLPDLPCEQASGAHELY